MTSSPSSVFFIFLLLTLLLTVSSDLEEDTRALLNFMDKVVGHEIKLTNWRTEPDTCKWFGVKCDPLKSSVIHLILPRASLVGEIAPDSLGKITSLRRLSLRSNKLSGQFPDDFADLTNLRVLDLSGNNFIGPIPENLTKIPMAAFSGNIYLCLDKNFHIIFPRKPFTQKRILSYIPPCEDTVISQQSQSALDSPSLNDKKEEKLCTAAIVVIAVGLALVLLILLSYLRKEWSKAVEEKNEPGVATKAAAKGFGKLD